MGTRILHTADWQLGLKLNFVAGDRGARARGERFSVIERIAALAKERGVDAVVVAGDVFDDNAVGPDTLRQASDALAKFAPVPVLLLPGNHDAAVPGCALERLGAGDGKLAHVRPLLAASELEIAGAAFLPCPLLRKHTSEDPTRWLPPREAGDDRVRIVIAHGGVLDFSESVTTPNLIDAGAVLQRGADYIALGDWHGTFRFGDRTWYSGTPEATRFKERDPGNVLIVEIDGAGAPAHVERVRVARTRWYQERRTLTGGGDVDELRTWFGELDEGSWSLVELTLDGSLGLADRARLDALLEEQEQSLLHLRIEADTVAIEPTEEDLRMLSAEGFVQRAIEDLRTSDDPDAMPALALLGQVPICV